MIHSIKRWWRFEAPYLFRNFKYGVKNLIRWFPIIWRDRDWDQFFIWCLLEKKLRHQSSYIGRHDRHMGSSRDARNMLICANLIKKINDEYYTSEYMDFCNTSFYTTPCDSPKGSRQLEIKLNWEKFDDYFEKYPRIYNQVINDPNFKKNDNKQSIAMEIGNINHRRAKKLLFKIMESEIDGWWD